MQSVVSALVQRDTWRSRSFLRNATRVRIRENRKERKSGGRGGALERRWAFAFLGNVKRHYVPDLEGWLHWIGRLWLSFHFTNSPKFVL